MVLRVAFVSGAGLAAALLLAHSNAHFALGVEDVENLEFFDIISGRAGDLVGVPELAVDRPFLSGTALAHD